MDAEQIKFLMTCAMSVVRAIVGESAALAVTFVSPNPTTDVLLLVTSFHWRFSCFITFPASELRETDYVTAIGRKSG